MKVKLQGNGIPDAGKSESLGDKPKTLRTIAEKLSDTDKKVQLIYAFNGSGKTRLSREFKELVAPKSEREDESASSRNKILYYNAFTEDLFYWDNDLQHDDEPRLRIQPNLFTEWVLKEQGQDMNVISNFQQYVSQRLMPKFSSDFSEVTFSIRSGDDTESGKLKISKGEESNFIWSIFYTLLLQVISILNVPEASEREISQFDQLQYVFIDDPVSSLDENHLIELAVELAALIKSCKSDLKFIITTHSPLFYNVLYNELNSKTCYLLQNCIFRSKPATDSAAKWATRSGANWSRPSAVMWATDSAANCATFST